MVDEFPSAASVYADYLKRQGSGDQIDLEVLCAQYPQLSDELRAMHLDRQEPAQAQLPVTNAYSHDLSAVSPATGHSATGHSAAANPSGQDRYRILQQVGHGGMGVVYKVWDNDLGRELAMKLVRSEAMVGNSESVDAEKLTRFTREAEITARLDHPGIVPIHEMDRDARGRPFFTMRLVQGERLDRIFSRVRRADPSWTQTRVLDVIVKVCETIAFAHSKGVIHRDLKPSNIMVGQFGETYVMDWGLAKYIRDPQTGERAVSEGQTDDAATDKLSIRQFDDLSLGSGANSETIAGTILGTAPFMPPEQAGGCVHELDERSDIYSAGAILYELLTGQFPYVPRGSNYRASDVVMAVIGGPPAPIVTINPRVSAELIAICEKAMSRRKDDRYQTMREMAEDLRAYLENRVVRAHQTGAIVEFKKWVARNRNTAIATLAAIAILISGLLSIVGIQSLANTRLEDANAKISKSNTEILDKNLRIEREVELKQAALEQEIRARQIADSEYRRAEGLLLARESANTVSSNPGLALLLALESDSRFPSFAANSAMLAALATHLEKKTLSGHRGGVRMASFDPEGTRVLTASDDSTAILWDPQTGQPIRWLLGHQSAVRVAKFSRDGKRILTCSFDRTAAIWDADTGDRIAEMTGHRGEVLTAAISPDGQQVATGSSDGTVRIWSAADGKSLAILNGHEGHVLTVLFSPTGQMIVSGASDGSIRLWDTAGNLKGELKGHTGGVTQMSFSDDGRLLLTSATHQSGANSRGKQQSSPKELISRLWDVATGQQVQELQHPVPVECSSLSPDGSRGITGTLDGTVRVFLCQTGEVERVINCFPGRIVLTTFSPDGRVMAAGSDRGIVWVWDVASGKELGRLRGHVDAIRAIAFNSRGQIVTSSTDQTARVWELQPPGRIAPAQVADYLQNQVEISPDGRRMAIHPRPGSSSRLSSFPEGHRVTDIAQESLIAAVQFSPSGRYLVARSASGKVCVAAAEDGAALHTLESKGRITHFSFQDDNRLVALSQPDQAVTTWNLENFEQIDRLERPQLQSMLLSPDASYLVGWLKDGNDAELWNLKTSKLIATLPQVRRSAQDIPFFSIGLNTLATWSLQHNSPRLWSLSDGRKIADLELGLSQGFTCLFSGDGQSFIAGSPDSHARVWDTSTGKLIANLNGFENSAPLLSINCDGTRAVTRSMDKRCRLWSGRDGKYIALLADRDESVESAQFSSDGKTLLTLNTKRDRVELWDADHGERIAVIGVTDERITDTAFSPDNQWFVLAFQDGSAAIQPIRPARTCASIVPRQLTPDERDLFHVGADQERAMRRRDSTSQKMIQFLKALGVNSQKSHQSRSLWRSHANARLTDLLATVPANSTKQERLRIVNDIEDRLRETDRLSPVASELMAFMYEQEQDYPRAGRLWRQAIADGTSADPVIWTAWLQCCFGHLNQSPQALLDDLPPSSSSDSQDVKWLLTALASDEPVRINAGGGDYVSKNGISWRHDCFFCGGHLFGEANGPASSSPQEILQTDDDPLYQTERWFERQQGSQPIGYRIPLPRGQYRVVLHFAEIYFQPPEQRVLEVLAEGKTVISGFDTLQAGFATARFREFVTRVEDGCLTLDFKGADHDPKISAIEIYRSSR